ncbi:MAG TPA: YSC84-related protein [bacterium]|nr:YSC84-related protein [bacterium]
MGGRRFDKRIVWALCVLLLGNLIVPSASHAKTAQEIDASVNAALDRFMQQVKGSREFLQDAKGVLVFAGVIQAGLGIGGEYGEGALRIHGGTAAYYSIAAASIGLQFGAQKKDIILVFLQDKALRDFRAKKGWQVGVDGSVVLVNLGAQASIDSTKYHEPIVGFVVGQKGLMYNLTLEGSKISKLQK